MYMHVCIDLCGGVGCWACCYFWFGNGQHIYMCLCVDLCTCVCTCVCVRVCVYVCVHVCVHVCTCVCVRTCVYMCARVWMPTYGYVNIE